MNRPATIADFLALPTKEQWQAALNDGWTGPDGSSSSTDLLMGIEIGRMSPSYRYARLPANRHDWMYYLGRRFRLPRAWRQRADGLYRDLCIQRLKAELKGPMLLLGILRAHLRYVALRLAGFRAWRTGSGAP